ncbi:MAG: hypothetical protein QM811_23810 [Pirellulales bacterium]
MENVIRTYAPTRLYKSTRFMTLLILVLGLWIWYPLCAGMVRIFVSIHAGIDYRMHRLFSIVIAIGVPLIILVLTPIIDLRRQGFIDWADFFHTLAFGVLYPGTFCLAALLNFPKSNG